MRAATTRVPFYRDHLAGAEPSSLASLPSFDKSMLAGRGRFPISAGGTAGTGGAHRVFSTSGTMGDRLCVALGRHDWDRVAAWLEDVGRSAAVGPEDVLLNTHCYGMWVGGPALDLLAHRTGACLVPVGPDDPARVIEFLEDGVGTAISATPSYLRRLAEAADAAGFDLARTGLRVGFIGAEPAEQALRDKLLSHLPDGFRWIELYGLTETGGPSVAFAPDPSVAELALNGIDFCFEVLDPKLDVPVPFREVGELTITSRWADSRTPLVRYRTRDLVRATAGSSMAPTRISRILGRVDHSLKICGVLVYPSSVAEIVTEMLPPSAEWQAVVRRQGEDDELLVEAEAPASVCRAIEEAFRDRLGLCVPVHSNPGDTMERSRAKTHRILVRTESRRAQDAPPLPPDSRE